MEKTELKERPIIMGAESVRAILEERKTQTRRVVKHIPALGLAEDWCHRIDNADFKHIVGDYRRFCPYGNVGDHLYVKEQFAWWRGRKAVAYSDMNHKDIVDNQWYDEVNISDIAEGGKWKSPIFMPRWASRITLEITNIRVERLQDITGEDALKEGFYNYGTEVDTLDAFCEAWQKLNAKRGYSWGSNPWVWVISFKQIHNQKEE